MGRSWSYGGFNLFCFFYGVVVVWVVFCDGRVECDRVSGVLFEDGVLD